MRVQIIAAAAGIAAVFAATVSVAQDDPVKARQALMKDVGSKAKVAGDMLQGKAPFDAEAAKAALQQISDHAAVFPTHFPEGSLQGETDALPVIWENKADFDAKAQKLSEDAATAAAAVDQGEEAFKAATGAMFSNCQGCHQVYRQPS
jgi:cytochrome c556